MNRVSYQRGVAVKPVHVQTRAFRPVLCLVALASVALLAVAASAQPAGARSLAAGANVASRRGDADFESRVAEGINDFRRHYGLRRLRVVPQLTRSARSHSSDMALNGYFSHDSRDGSDFATRIKHFYGASGFRYWSVGETILWAGSSLRPYQAIQRWLDSPPHRVVLLSQGWRAFGIGVAHSSGGILLVTADFGTRY